MTYVVQKLNNLMDIDPIADDFFTRNGVMQQLHVVRSRGNCNIDLGFFNLKGSQTSALVSSYAKLGSISFVPKSVDSKLKRIESRLRSLRTRLAIGLNNQYMTLENFDYFSGVVEEYRKEYLEVRDEIVSKFDDYMANFKNAMILTFDELNVPANEKADYLERIMNMMPTKDVYQASFDIYVSVQAFPRYQEVTELPPALQEKMKEDYIQNSLNLVKEGTVKCLQAALDSLSIVYNKYTESHTIPNKTRGSLSHAAKTIQRGNIFGNMFLDNLANALSSAKYDDADDLIETIESLMIDVYTYSTSHDLKLDYTHAALSEYDLNVLAP